MYQKTKKSVLVFFAISLCSVFVACGQNDESIARALSQFEIDWLMANLNGDGRWLERLIAGNLEVGPDSPKSIKEREKFTSEILDTNIPDDARKVRISGTISFLTNDPRRNRSFQFLDTFNRRNGKWEAIASSFSATGNTSGTTAESKEQVEIEIRRLDMEAANAVLNKDEAAIGRLFTEDSVTNNPRNGLTHGSAGVIEAARTGLINYHSFERTIESVQVLGNTVVIMGNETVIAKNRSGGPGETFKRRYTNVWMKTDENWRIVARHASIISG